MYILLPMDGQDANTVSLVKLNDVKVWMQIQVEDGELKSVTRSEDKDSFENFSECVVVENDDEYVWPFMELSMLVLVAHTQRSVEEIVEGYLFKELHDLAY